MRSCPRVPAALVATVAALLLSSCDSGDERRSAQTAWEPSQTTYYHQGIAPGPSLTTDRLGALIEERRYEAFGQSVDAFRPGAGVVAVDFRRDPQNILGKQTDPNTGWSYHGARWMAPQTARWSTPDPAIKGPDQKLVQAPWGLNPYAYASGNPALFWDPDGRRASWRENVPVWARVVATVFLAAPVMDWAERRANDVSAHPNDNVAKARAVLGAPVVALEHAKSLANRAEAVSQGAKAVGDWADSRIPGKGPYGTRKNEAVFWTGIGDKTTPGYDKAEQWAAQHGGKTLEMVLKEQGVNMPKYDRNNPVSVQAWEDASKLFAQGARGDIRVLQSPDKLRPDATFGREFQALRQNAEVNSITAVNPDTGQETELWHR